MGRLNKFAFSLIMLVCTMFQGSFVRGQGPNQTALPIPASTIQTAKPPQAKNPIRVQSSEVVVPVSVMDKSGENVLDLTQNDFHVFDNGVEQKITRWDLSGDPLAVGLV